eukprot:m.716156 g.716156  ORF g.716156 m.716156 type:complete len:487 (-) comp22983_c0_seq1:209-1669(-)
MSAIPTVSSAPVIASAICGGGTGSSHMEFSEDSSRCVWEGVTFGAASLVACSSSNNGLKFSVELLAEPSRESSESMFRHPSFSRNDGDATVNSLISSTSRCVVGSSESNLISNCFEYSCRRGFFDTPEPCRFESDASCWALPNPLEEVSPFGGLCVVIVSLTGAKEDSVVAVDVVSLLGDMSSGTTPMLVAPDTWAPRTSESPRRCLDRVMVAVSSAPWRNEVELCLVLYVVVVGLLSNGRSASHTSVKSSASWRVARTGGVRGVVLYTYSPLVFPLLLLRGSGRAPWAWCDKESAPAVVARRGGEPVDVLLPDETREAPGLCRIGLDCARRLVRAGETGLCGTKVGVGFPCVLSPPLRGLSVPTARGINDAVVRPSTDAGDDVMVADCPAAMSALPLGVGAYDAASTTTTSTGRSAGRPPTSLGQPARASVGGVAMVNIRRTRMCAWRTTLSSTNDVHGTTVPDSLSCCDFAGSNDNSEWRLMHK